MRGRTVGQSNLKVPGMTSIAPIGLSLKHKDKYLRRQDGDYRALNPEQIALLCEGPCALALLPRS